MVENPWFVSFLVMGFGGKRWKSLEKGTDVVNGGCSVNVI